MIYSKHALVKIKRKPFLKINSCWIHFAVFIWLMVRANDTLTVEAEFLIQIPKRPLLDLEEEESRVSQKARFESNEGD